MLQCLFNKTQLKRSVEDIFSPKNFSTEKINFLPILSTKCINTAVLTSHLPIH